jgi:hypothetical protein
VHAAWQPARLSAMPSQQLQALQSAAKLGRRWRACSPVLPRCATDLRHGSSSGARVHGTNPGERQYLIRLLLSDRIVETVLATTLQAAGVDGSRSEPAAGAGPTSGPASQPQSQGRQRITALLEAWTQQWRATQLPKLQADAYRCMLQIDPVFDHLLSRFTGFWGHPAGTSARWHAHS